MELLTVVQAKNCRCVTVVGMAKNTGKTVTLNRLILEGYKSGLKLAITSSGRDGESKDLVWRNVKPRIWIPRGAIVATVLEGLKVSYAELKVIKQTNYFTPLGQVVLAVAKTSGFVQVAGPSLGSQLAELSGDLLSLGMDLVLIDGAMDRMVSAAPKVADGMILATGAILAPTPEIVLQQTLARIEQLTIGTIADEVKERLGGRKEVLGITAGGQAVSLGIISALGNEGKIAEYLADKPWVDGLYLPGALTDKILHALSRQLGALGKFTLVVEDGTKVLVSSQAWKTFRSQGGEVIGISPIKVLALTLNPYSPLGLGFAAEEFLQLAKARFPNLPVFDLCLMSK